MQEQPWIFVAEISVAVDDEGTLHKHYACSSEGFATRPDDMPANTTIPPTLLDPGSLRREMFAGDKPFGAVRPAFGEVVLYNGDGRYDAWELHGFDGRDFVLRWGPYGGAYPAEFHTVLICTVEGITLTETEARLRLRDNTSMLDKAFLRDSFQGGSTAEGGSELVGRAKHRYIGTPRFTGPAPQSISNAWGGTIYHLTTGQVNSVLAWDNGNELEWAQGAGGNFWRVDSAPAEGTFWVGDQDGNTYLRVGSKVVGDLRVYASTVQAGGAQWTMQALLAETGYAGPVRGTSLPLLGVVVADAGITYARLFDDIAAAAGMWYGFDRLGHFVSNPFDEPTGNPVLTLHRGNCTGLKRSPVQGMEVPIYQLSVNSGQTWKSNYTAPINWVRERFQADQWLTRLNHVQESVRKKHPAARSLHMDLLMGPDSGREWNAMRARYMRMFGVDRSCITAAVPLSVDMLALDLGDCVRVQWPRFNLAAGRLFRVIALRYSLRARQIEIVLWG